MTTNLQICSVNLVVRELEWSVVKITPDRLTMESETVLTQYIIKNWTLAYRNISKTILKFNINHLFQTIAQYPKASHIITQLIT